MSLLGPVVEPGPRRRPAEPQIVGSNPTRPALNKLPIVRGLFLCFGLGTLLWIIRSFFLPEHVSNPVAFHGKTAWITAFIIALVFLMPVLGISLPSVTLPGMRAMDVTSLRTPTYAESNPARILAENNWTLWNLGAGQGGFTLNYSESGLSLSGSLPPSSEPSAFSISRRLSVNLTEYPVMYMLVDVTPSAGYGIRFYSSRLGLETPLWSESDALNHRSG